VSVSGAHLSLAFHVLTALILPLWILMLLLPRWELSVRILRSPWSVAPIALAYAAVVLPQIGTVLAHVLAPDPASQAAYFGTAAGYLAISAHVLALDLFAGRWAYLDGYAAGRSPWIMSPVLFLVMLLGPLGVLLYLAIRVRAARAAASRCPTSPRASTPSRNT
jgi:hypothetical protein